MAQNFRGRPTRYLCAIVLVFAYYFPIVPLIVSSVTMIICISLTVYASSIPVPAGLPQPWVLRYNAVAEKIVGLTGRNLYDVIAYWSKVKSRCKITNTTFDGVKVRVYRPRDVESDKPLPAVVYMHGGGFRCLSVDTLHSFADDLGSRLDTVVISIDYRLSSKAIFPAAIDDCTKATVWFLQHTEDYNVDSTKVAVMGASAGGNLAAGVAQRLTFDPQYSDLPTLRLQILMYPMLQAIDFNTPSYQQNGKYAALLLPKQVVVDSWAAYLTSDKKLQKKFSAIMKSATLKDALSHDNIPDRFKEDGYVAPGITDLGDEGLYGTLKASLFDPSCAPLMRDSLRGLPEAYVATCTYDILRDDGIQYVRKLKADDVTVTWMHYDDGVHCMAQFSADGPFSLDAGFKCRKEVFAFISYVLKERRRKKRENAVEVKKIDS